MTQHQDSLLI